MPIPLGVLAVAGAGGAAGGGAAYEWLETVSVGTAVASVSFSNLNSSYGSTYQHLQVRMVVNGSRAAAEDTMYLTLNNTNSGNLYANHRLKGTGSSVVSNASTSQNFGIFEEVLANDYWPIPSFMVMDILDPFETTKNKTIRTMQGAGADYGITLHSMLFNSTAALTTLKFEFANGNVRAGSRFSLYGMRSS